MISADIILPAVVAFVASAFTLMTGFGLGTILTPIFLLFYDVKIAILIVAVVHLANNILKLSLFRKHIGRDILKRFGMLTILGAFIGAFLQGEMDSSAVKVLLGIILIFLGMKEVSKIGEHIRLPRKIDFIGGFLSGLLGGFVGNQGAIRSAYLLNYPVSKETFIVTAATIASIVDITRIPVYVYHNRNIISDNMNLLLITMLLAFAGTFAGSKFVKTISLKTFKYFVAAAIIIIGVLLAGRLI